jgi:hypothetical protein
MVVWTMLPLVLLLGVTETLGCEYLYLYWAMSTLPEVTMKMPTGTTTEDRVVLLVVVSVVAVVDFPVLAEPFC